MHKKKTQLIGGTELENSFEKAVFGLGFKNRSVVALSPGFEKSCLSRKLFVTHSSVGNCVKVRTRRKVWRLMTNSFGRLRSDCYINQSKAG